MVRLSRFRSLRLIAPLLGIALGAFGVAPAMGDASDTHAPIVELHPGTFEGKQQVVYVPQGKGFDLWYYVSDDSGYSRVAITIYSGGTQVDTPCCAEQAPAKAVLVNQFVAAVHPTNALEAGPYYACIGAEDPSGNKSINYPQSSCIWLSLEVPLNLVANGCGGQQWGPIAGRLQTRLLDKNTYFGVKVSFKDACDQHDAGYSGVTVMNQYLGKVVDYRNWPRGTVDQWFLADLQTECDIQLKNKLTVFKRSYCRYGPTLDRFVAGIKASHAVFAIPCALTSGMKLQAYIQPGAFTYFQAVRKCAVSAYDSDAIVPGIQHTHKPPSSLSNYGLSGSSRDNT
ncbi:MAG: hypothetical protein Q7L55_08755 [Actinomycetota bacterium]|nr:hypothetical protein [Actinomycetota bacterium]